MPKPPLWPSSHIDEQRDELMKNTQLYVAALNVGLSWFVDQVSVREFERIQEEMAQHLSKIGDVDVTT